MSLLPLIYVAGPYTAPTRAGVEANIARAVDLGVCVADLGAVPIIPHANSAHPDFAKVQPYDWWIKATLAMLRVCRGVIFTHDWQKSSGARGEHTDAIARDMPVFYSLSELAAWLSEQRRLGT